MTNPVLAVDPSLDIAPYQQIVEQIRGLIQSGALAPEATLPTVRQLADDLNVAPNTVARAYTGLQDDGWLVSEGRRGTHVARRLPDLNKAARSQTLRDSVEHFITTLVGRGYSRSEILGELAGLLANR